MKINTTLRQWCKDCQAATTSILCGACPGRVFICSACHSGHDGEHEREGLGHAG